MEAKAMESHKIPDKWRPEPWNHIKIVYKWKPELWNHVKLHTNGGQSYGIT